MIFTYFIEIKNRILLIILAWFFLIITSYYYKEIILFIITQPNFSSVQDLSFYFITTNVIDTFYVYLKLSYFVSFQLTSVFILYHFFKFINPALYKKELFLIKNIIVVSIYYWILIIYLFNQFIFPVILNFFFKYQQINSKIIKIYFELEFSEFIKNYCLYFYIIYTISQIFIILLLYLNKTNKHIQFVKRFRKIIYTIFLLQSTFLTPPDVFSQICIGLCLILIYEFLVITTILKKRFLVFEKQKNLNLR